MRAFRFLLILALGFGASAAHRVEAQTLRVMTFNVRMPSPNDGPNLWEKRRDLMVDTIRQAHPDVMGTQELYKRQGDYLVSKLPPYRWFGIGRFGNDGDEHMGVFYRTDRLRVIKSGNFWLSDTPHTPGSNSWGTPFPRMVTWALFQLKADGRRFYYLNTHLFYRDQDEPARTRAAKEILAWIRTLPAQLPIVMTGDFNTTPASQTHALLTGVLRDARLTASRHDGPEATFHNFTGKPDRRIDWILYRGLEANAEHTITTHRGDHYPSDHFPVLAEVSWPGNPGKHPPSVH